MKKTLVVLAVVIGLSMTAAALPPVTLDESCEMSATLMAEYVAFMDVVDDDLDANLTDFESLYFDNDPDVDDWVWATGVPDTFKLALLGAAICADSELAADFDDNREVFVGEGGFVAKLNALVTYGEEDSGNQAAIVAAGTAVGNVFADATVLPSPPFPPGTTVGAYLLANFPAALTSFGITGSTQALIMAVVTPIAPGEAAMLLLDRNSNGLYDQDDPETEADEGDECALFEDEDDDGVFDVADGDVPYYAPYLCTAIAALIEEDIGMAGSSARQFAGGMEFFFSNVVPAVLSLSTADADGLVNYSENDLLADFREFADLFGQFGLVFGQVIPGYISAVNTQSGGLINKLGEVPAVLAGAGAFLAGQAAIDDIVLPELPILGAIVKAAEDEPFGNLGDYDGDDASNQVAYETTDGVDEFVAAASGANPFYGGNPLLPAAGIIGLAALVSAFAAGGAFVLRKK